jgi:hypothetical protein
MYYYTQGLAYARNEVELWDKQARHQLQPRLH